MKKIITLLVILGLAGLLGWQIYRKVKETEGPAGGGRGRPSQAAVAVEVAPVRVASISDVRRFTGTLLPRAQFSISPQVGGRLQKLLVDMGDEVSRDQLIAVLDSQEYAQQVEQAKAELEVAQANVAECLSSLDVARRDLERVTALREKQIASESELDEARARYKAAEAKHQIAMAQVAQRQAGLESARIRLSYTQINASWRNGDDTRVVGERFVSEGAVLRANDPIVSILDIGELKVEIFVNERDYARLRVGQPVIVNTDAHPGVDFHGSVVRIAPLLRETSRQARVEALAPNPDHMLKPGMFVLAHIELGSRDDAVVAPFSALVRRDEKQGVFLVDRKEMKARFIPIETGIVSGDVVEIIHPRIEGEVVTLGHHLLVDGSAILIPEFQRMTGASQAGAAPSVNDNSGERRGSNQ